MKQSPVHVHLQEDGPSESKSTKGHIPEISKDDDGMRAAYTKNTCSSSEYDSARLASLADCAGLFGAGSPMPSQPEELSRPVNTEEPETPSEEKKGQRPRESKEKLNGNELKLKLGNRLLSFKEKRRRASVGSMRLFDMYEGYHKKNNLFGEGGASKGIAKKYAEARMMHQVDKDDEEDVALLPLCTPIDELDVQGGVHAYLETLQGLALIFLILFIINIPSLVYYAQGNNLQTFTSTLTIANLGGRGESDSVAGMGRKDIGLMVSLLDLFTVIFYYIALFVLEIHMDKHRLRNRITVASYSIASTNMVKAGQSTTKEEVKQYFSKFGHVVDVAILKNRTRLVQKYVERRRLIEMKNEHVRRYEKDIEFLKYFSEELLQLEATIKELGEIPERTRYVVITFQTKQAKIDALRELSKHESDREIGLFKGLRIDVHDAAEPSDLNYEKFDYSNATVYRFRFWILLLFLVFLCCCVIATLFILDYKSSLPLDISCTEDSYSKDVITSGNADSSYRWCYCQSLGRFEVLRDQECKSYLEQRTLQRGISMLFATAVAFCELIIFVVVPKLTRWDMHAAKSGTEKAIMWRVGTLSFLLNGPLVFLVTLDLNKLLGISFWFTNSKYTAISGEWFRNIGFTILLTVGAQFSTTMIPVLQYIAMKTRRCYARCFEASFSQWDMNLLYAGTNLRLGYKYASLIVVSQVVMAFSPGMPLLYLLGACIFKLGYFVERWALVRLYNQPPTMNLRVSDSGLMSLYHGIILHCVAAFVVYGSSSFVSAYEFGHQNEKLGVLNGLNNWNGLPHFIMCALMLIVTLLHFFADKVYRYKMVEMLEYLGLWKVIQWIDRDIDMPTRDFFSELREGGLPLETYHMNHMDQYAMAYVKSDDGYSLPPSVPFYLQPKYQHEYYKSKREFNIVREIFAKYHESVGGSYKTRETVLLEGKAKKFSKERASLASIEIDSERKRRGQRQSREALKSTEIESKQIVLNDEDTMIPLSTLRSKLTIQEKQGRVA